MSTSLVRQSLEVVDSDFSSTKSRTVNRTQDTKKNLNIKIPENQNIFTKIKRKGQKAKNVTVLKPSIKTTIAEARTRSKSKEEILQSNLKKLKLIEEACKIDFRKDLTSQFLKRAVLKRPVGKISAVKQKRSEESAFTEEDFKNFDAEYCDS